MTKKNKRITSEEPNEIIVKPGIHNLEVEWRNETQYPIELKIRVQDAGEDKTTMEIVVVKQTN